MGPNPNNVIPLNASDYAILKFNNATNQNGSVGKEIDVWMKYWLKYWLILQPLILRPKLEADTEPADLEDDLVYADSDYRDLYAYGPVCYTQTSRHAAQTKKEEIAKRYGTIGRK